jgi:hypothetical protein
MSWFVPDCEESLKLIVEMTFDRFDEVEEFYKSYAHGCGFSVRIGAQGKKSNVVDHKWFVCLREGFTKRKAKPCKQNKLFETRCGCNACIYVRLSQDKRYYILLHLSRSITMALYHLIKFLFSDQPNNQSKRQDYLIHVPQSKYWYIIGI